MDDDEAVPEADFKNLPRARSPDGLPFDECPLVLNLLQVRGVHSPAVMVVSVLAMISVVARVRVPALRVVSSLAPSGEVRRGLVFLGGSGVRDAEFVQLSQEVFD